MSNTTYTETKCVCRNCSQHFAFDRTMAGQTIPCPSCGIDTELFIPAATQRPPPARPRSLLRRFRFHLSVAAGLLLAAFAVFKWLALPEDDAQFYVRFALALFAFLIAAGLSALITLGKLWPQVIAILCYAVGAGFALNGAISFARGALNDGTYASNLNLTLSACQLAGGLVVIAIGIIAHYVTQFVRHQLGTATKKTV